MPHGVAFHDLSSGSTKGIQNEVLNTFLALPFLPASAEECQTVLI